MVRALAAQSGQDVSNAKEASGAAANSWGLYQFAGIVESIGARGGAARIRWEKGLRPEEGTLLYFRLYSQHEIDLAEAEASALCDYFQQCAAQDSVPEQSE